MSKMQERKALEGAAQPIWVPECYVRHHHGPREAPCPIVQNTESCPDDSNPDDSKAEKEDDEGYARDRGANMGSAEEVNN
ncbi:hypothetical protein QTO34_013101 [Cnephaeus nilssonii]|uniref:Uncharacterized protein n=1 Tax=Cnephaeus nilssonii TaxID=3371016 RepID=A0AA40I7D0_CNENI|nr:hypothetical protein QTO34_013101 [Eptesicus nilssonii]